MRYRYAGYEADESHSSLANAVEIRIADMY